MAPWCAAPIPRQLVEPRADAAAPLAEALGEAGRFLDARCAIAPAALGALRAAERCDGRGVHDGDEPRLNASAWGLPAAGCPAPSAELVGAYSRRHAWLKAQGRVLQYCYHAPLGNYLEALPAALLISILVDLALVLHCDVRPGDHMAQFRTKVASVLPRYFHGPHIDWSGRAALPLNATDLRQRAGAFGVLARARAGMRAQLNIRAQPSAVLANARNRARLRAALGAPLADHPNLAGCLLRFLLAPTARLGALVGAVQHAPAATADGRALRAVAMHVRLGDHFLGATRGKDADSRSVAYQRDPLRAMRCLLRAAAERAGGGGGGGNGGGCLQAVVVSDSGWVEACARRVLRAVAITPGVALHPHKSAGRALGDGAVDKLVTDWWLLAQSRGLVMYVDGSSFSRMARAFRDASDPLGWSLVIGHALAAEPAACEQPRAAETAVADWSRAPFRLSFCAAAMPLGCATRGMCALARAPLSGEGALAALVAALAATAAVALARTVRRALAWRARGRAQHESELAPFLRPSGDAADADG
ncbi:hypothetical protein KFE25_012865 [Diacronema lutheri]|uniref:Uncharacterized protein n=2 Tax=Diacronema lutheri TaxID=2081491 RepID=A0A8J6C754_DIALT|nr:hypothetical protein KFE25_012865 [Diacronema lutheri]